MSETGKSYQTLITNVGCQKIAAAAMNEEKVNITQAAVGDGGGAYYLPTADMTALKNEVWRGEIASAGINEDATDTIDVRVVLDSTIGGFTIRELGLFDSDGDMIAICNVPDTEKTPITTGAAGALSLIMHVLFTDAGSVTFTVNTSVDAVSMVELEAKIDAAQTAAATDATSKANQALADAKSYTEQTAESITASVANLEKAATVTEMIPYYALGGADTPPLDDTSLTAALADSAVVGEAVVTTWSTETPEADEGEYIWQRHKITYQDGSSKWSDPALATDTGLARRIAQLEQQTKYLLELMTSALAT